jgi:methyl-accepting chemotaxis protein
VARVTNAVMVWQVASVIVAQKHLADISAELDDIKKVMDGIKAFLEHERAAKITAALTYLEQLFQTISQGELPSGSRHEVESLEVKLIEVQDHLAGDIGDLTEGILRIEHSDLVGTREFAHNIEKHQELMHGVQQLWVLCIRARAANWQILSGFPGEDHLKSARMTQIMGSIDKLTNSIPQIDKMTQDKIAEVDAFFNRQETLEERRNHLRERHEEFQGEIISAVERARTQVSQVASRLSPGRTVLAVRTAQGKVVEAYELDQS